MKRIYYIVGFLALLLSFASFAVGQGFQSPSYLDFVDAATNYLKTAVDPEGNGTDRLPLGSASDPLPALYTASLSPASIDDAGYIDIDAAGVRLDSDDDGALTITGNGNGFDETLSINLDDTDNTATLGGVSTLDMNGITMVNVPTINAGDINATSINTNDLTTNSSFVSSGDAVIGNLTPAYVFKDTSASAGDENVKIEADCTDTGNGTEDCDIGWFQQINGVLTQIGLADADGSWQILKNLSIGSGFGLFLPNDSSINLGSSAFGSIWDTNGTGDSILTTIIQKAAATDSAAMWLARDLNPNNMTLADDYLSPTLLMVNDEGADANDASMVIVGERAQSNVAAAHYFDLFATTGAADGSANGTTSELAATFRVGDGSSTPTYAAAQDLFVTNDLEAKGKIIFPGSIQDVGATCTAGEWALDTGGATQELCVCRTTNTWTCVSATTTSGPTN